MSRLHRCVSCKEPSTPRRQCPCGPGSWRCGPCSSEHNRELHSEQSDCVRFVAAVLDELPSISVQVRAAWRFPIRTESSNTLATPEAPG